MRLAAWCRDPSGKPEVAVIVRGVLILLRQTRQPLVRPLRSLTAAGAAVEGLGEADRQRAEHGCQ